VALTGFKAISQVDPIAWYKLGIAIDTTLIIAEKNLPSAVELKHAAKAGAVKRLVATTFRCLGCHHRYLICEANERHFRIVTPTSCMCADCEKCIPEEK